MWTDEEIAQLVRVTRAEQELPETIDETTVTRIVGLLSDLTISSGLLQ